MKRLILTESDLATIENGLLEAECACRADAEMYPALREASLESAEKYGALAELIAEADQIRVERIP
jgi:hypothetical protein